MIFLSVVTLCKSTWVGLQAVIRDKCTQPAFTPHLKKEGSPFYNLATTTMDCSCGNNVSSSFVCMCACVCVCVCLCVCDGKGLKLGGTGRNENFLAVSEFGSKSIICQSCQKWQTFASSSFLNVRICCFLLSLLTVSGDSRSDGKSNVKKSLWGILMSIFWHTLN